MVIDMSPGGGLGYDKNISQNGVEWPIKGNSAIYISFWSACWRDSESHNSMT